MNDWRIHRREPSCARCERAFEEGEGIFSLLFLDADRLRREDRCLACFEEARDAAGSAESGERAPGAALFWRTRHRLDRRARFAVDFEAIEEFFLVLEGRRETRLAELRYLLCLLLLRKKRLRLVGVRRNGEAGETLCVRRPRRAEEFEVQVFELDAQRAETLRAELARVFEGAGTTAFLETPLPGKKSPVAEPSSS